MKYTLIPSIIAQSQVELDKRLTKIQSCKPSLIQLDIMDGSLVPHTSLEFDFFFPKRVKAEAHLMIRNPHAWMLKHNASFSSLLVHYESKAHLHDMIKSAHVLKKKIGIALNPETDSEAITQYLTHIDKVLIMTVHPGKYGAPFLPSMLKKIKNMREHAPRLDIEVDGGLTPATLAQCKLAGANQFVVGSFLQGARDIKKAWATLQKVIKK